MIKDFVTCYLCYASWEALNFCIKFLYSIFFSLVDLFYEINFTTETEIMPPPLCDINANIKGWILLLTNRKLSFIYCLKKNTKYKLCIHIYKEKCILLLFSFLISKIHLFSLQTKRAIEK